jgi:hypothetical protein
MSSRTELIVIGVVTAIVLALAGLGFWYMYYKNSSGGNTTGIFAYGGKDLASSQECVQLFIVDYAVGKLFTGDARGSYAKALSQISKNAMCPVACMDHNVPWVDLSTGSCLDEVSAVGGINDGTVTCQKLGAAIEGAVKNGKCSPL